MSTGLIWLRIDKKYGVLRTFGLRKLRNVDVVGERLFDYRTVPANVSTVIGGRHEQSCVSGPLELYTASRRD